MQHMDNKMITVREAQKILNVNRKAIYKMIASGKLVTQKIGSNIQISKKSLSLLLDCCKNLPKDDNYKTVEDVTTSEMRMISDWT